MLIKDQGRLDHPALRPVAQGVGSILGGPLAALLREQTGSWLPVFAIIIAMDVLTEILALFVLKPMRRAYANKAAGLTSNLDPKAASLRGRLDCGGWAP